MFENGALVKTFEPKRDEVTREWRRLHNEGLSDLHSSPNVIRIISRRLRRAGHVSCMGKRRGEYKILVGRHEGKSLCGKGRIILKQNFRI